MARVSETKLSSENKTARALSAASTETYTDFTLAMANSVMPAPGVGTNNLGDTPQEFLFLVTDGVVDDNNNGREMIAMGGSWCTTIKNRGIKIAVLYTTYKPLPTNSFYNQYISPFNRVFRRH